MVGSEAAAGGDRSIDAVKMMALHDALRSLCLSSDWTYSVLWTIRRRPRVRGGYGCQRLGDDNGSLMLMWEDGFCRGKRRECFNEMDEEDPIRKAFSRMSIQLYNYGEGLMGKVASDKCHKWVVKQPTQCEQPNISNNWQSSFDVLPTDWSEQFDSGIQTIAVIQAGHGLLQLGSCKVIAEDLHFVLRMRQMFESLGYQSGFYFSQLFSTAQNAPSPSTAMAPTFQQGRSPSTAQMPPSTEELQMHILPSSSSDDSLIGEQDIVIKWPTGLSFSDVIAGETKLLLNREGIASQPKHNGHHHPNETPDLGSGIHPQIGSNFKRSYTLPARAPTSSSSPSLRLSAVVSRGVQSNENRHF